MSNIFLLFFFVACLSISDVLFFSALLGWSAAFFFFLSLELSSLLSVISPSARVAQLFFLFVCFGVEVFIVHLTFSLSLS